MRVSVFCNRTRLLAKMKRREWIARLGQLAGVLGVLVLVAASPVAASEGGVPGFEPYKMMWAALNFFILLALLYKFAYDPILQMLDERRNTIESSLRHAEEVRIEIERMKKEAQENLLEARREAQEIVARATKIGEETREEIIQRAKEEANAERQRAVMEINSAKEKALSELRDTAATLAILAAEKVLGRAITVEDHQKMVRQFVDEVGDRLC